jgi:hypothetical protein
VPALRQNKAAPDAPLRGADTAFAHRAKMAGLR